ncbi:hypothetical protein [Paenibacillus radicis (ex Gao et al. 2016)]|uniref:Lipoprotein n=1 Tax=Paenibacillus radicis (ex Gao et al. 2016) TaxID=1737354 RepID=A0A917HWM8_9BACL|nr:hypothetical protein [Paenibacillus radicis (ex Gao et al. 2016)]GGG91036.1 hypothetical protein GCM10010918_57650 [Paenibacillus radicis (ex Gao et al. 2016)]
MKKFIIVFSILLMSLSLPACSFGRQQTAQDWAYRFVVWNGDTYKATDETVLDVEKQIGKVEHYSDHESTRATGVFSNEYQKGTALYKIKDVSTEKAIAVESSEGNYVLLENIGRYGSKDN